MDPCHLWVHSRSPLYGRHLLIYGIYLICFLLIDTATAYKHIQLQCQQHSDQKKRKVLLSIHCLCLCRVIVSCLLSGYEPCAIARVYLGLSWSILSLSCAYLAATSSLGCYPHFQLFSLIWLYYDITLDSLEQVVKLNGNN